jgi:FMN-dependent NADH-azoreductase
MELNVLIPQDTQSLFHGIASTHAKGFQETDDEHSAHRLEHPGGGLGQPAADPGDRRPRAQRPSGGHLSFGPATDPAANAAALEEFLAADVIVIGAPIYNFSIPSQLKAWIDRIAVAGRTFRYTAAGPEGLVRGKTVIVALSRGGVHVAGAGGEFGESYLKFLFGFLGIEDVRFVRAQGLSVSPEQRAAALAAAVAAVHAPARRAA